VNASVEACVLLALYLTNHWTEFHQTSIDDVVEATDELTRFFGGRKDRCPGHGDVKYLSESLLRVEAYTSTFGR